MLVSLRLEIASEDNFLLLSRDRRNKQRNPLLAEELSEFAETFSG